MAETQRQGTAPSGSAASPPATAATIVPAVIRRLQQGRRAAAEALCREALARAPASPDALIGLSIIAEGSGRLDEAIALLERVVASSGRVEHHLHLARLLHAAGRDREVAAACRKRIGERPDDVGALIGLAAILQAQGDVAGAVQVYGGLVSIRPDNADGWFSLGTLLHQHGRSAEAIGPFRRAIALDPRFAAGPTLGNALLKQGAVAEAVAAYEACLRLSPGDRRAIAQQAAALWQLGRRDEARRLVDFDRFLRPVAVDPPEGYASIAAFNAALARFVTAHPTLAFEPPQRSTRHGSQTGQIERETSRPLAALQRIIRGKVADYLDSLGDDPAHPFFATLPNRWWASIWATVLGAQGHQTTHIHPDGHVSGVYYVRVPQTVAADVASQQGWIEFGRPPAALNCRAKPAVRTIQPVEGLMLLFPSYFYHRTIPFQSEEQRISIAFDIVSEA